MEKLSDIINAHIRAKNYHRAWQTLRPFYKKATKIYPPSVGELDRIGQEFQELYQRTTPTGEALRGLQKFDIKDDAPNENEVAEALHRMRSGKSPGPSGICTEDIRTWYNTRITDPLPWKTVLSIITAAFSTGELPTLLHCNILVLIPKSEPGKVRGIGLLESIWKLITTIIHVRLSSAIKFHPDMHGFLPKRGC